jgi:hypothetical protein
MWDSTSVRPLVFIPLHGLVVPQRKEDEKFRLRPGVGCGANQEGSKWHCRTVAIAQNQPPIRAGYIWGCGGEILLHKFAALDYRKARKGRQPQNTQKREIEAAKNGEKPILTCTSSAEPASSRRRRLILRYRHIGDSRSKSRSGPQ